MFGTNRVLRSPMTKPASGVPLHLEIFFPREHPPMWQPNWTLTITLKPHLINHFTFGAPRLIRREINTLHRIDLCAPQRADAGGSRDWLWATLSTACDLSGTFSLDFFIGKVYLLYWTFFLIVALDIRAAWISRIPFQILFSVTCAIWLMDSHCPALLVYRADNNHIFLGLNARWNLGDSANDVFISIHA